MADKFIFHDPDIDFGIDIPDPKDLVDLIDEWVQEQERRTKHNFVGYIQKLYGKYVLRIYGVWVKSIKNPSYEYKEVIRVVEGYNIKYVKDLLYHVYAGYRINWGQSEYYPLDTSWGTVSVTSCNVGYYVLNDPTDIIKSDPEIRYCGYDFVWNKANSSIYSLFNLPDFITYISYWRKVPGVEILAKLDLMNCLKLYRMINFNGKSFLQMFKVPYDKIHWIRQYGLLIARKANRLRITPNEYHRLKDVLPKGVTRCLTPKSARKILDKYCCERKHRTTYRDYLAMCQQLGKDLKDEYWLLPKDVEKAHQKVVDELHEKEEAEKAAEDEKTLKKFVKIVEKYSDIETRIGNYAIILPKSPSDLRREGLELHHCVGHHLSYLDNMIRGKRWIIFVRRLPDIDKSLETVEFDLETKEILQCRGAHNQPSLYHEEIQQVLNIWRDKCFQLE